MAAVPDIFGVMEDNIDSEYGLPELTLQLEDTSDDDIDSSVSEMSNYSETRNSTPISEQVELTEIDVSDLPVNDMNETSNPTDDQHIITGTIEVEGFNIRPSQPLQLYFEPFHLSLDFGHELETLSLQHLHYSRDHNNQRLYLHSDGGNVNLHSAFLSMLARNHSFMMNDSISPHLEMENESDEDSSEN